MEENIKAPSVASAKEGRPQPVPYNGYDGCGLPDKQLFRLRKNPPISPKRHRPAARALTGYTTKIYTTHVVYTTQRKADIPDMTEEEARSILKTHGWSYKERAVHKGGPKYIYAKQRQGLEVKERYLCPLAKLGELTEADIAAKLAPPSAEEPDARDPQITDKQAAYGGILYSLGSLASVVLDAISLTYRSTASADGPKAENSEKIAIAAEIGKSIVDAAIALPPEEAINIREGTALNEIGDALVAMTEEQLWIVKNEIVQIFAGIISKAGSSAQQRSLRDMRNLLRSNRPLPRQPQTARPGIVQYVLFTIALEQVEEIASRMSDWFQGRDEITFIDVGLSIKQKTAFIVVKWTGYEIDPLFLTVLKDEALVKDFIIYDEYPKEDRP